MTSPPTNGRLKLVLIIGGLSAFGPLSMDLYLPALPSLTRDLGGSASLVQLTLTACLLGLAAGQVVAGPLSDALGRRRPLFVGLAAYVLASLLCALAPSAPLLVVFRLIQGTAAASGVVIARAVVRDVYQGSDVARFLALTMLISGLAPILAPMLGGQLLRVTSCLLPHRRPFTREEIRCQPCIHGATRRPRGRSLVVMPIPPRAVRPKGAAPGGAKVTPAAHVAGCPYLLPAHPFVSSLPSSRRLPGSLFFPLPPRVASTCVT